MDVDPQTEFSGALHKSKFRSLAPDAESSKQKHATRPAETDQSSALTPLAQNDLAAQPEDRRARQHPLARSHVAPISPPLTPGSSASSDLANTTTTTTASDSAPQLPASPPPILPVVPPSPYDPLLTPSFRHSPPRLPSDQPWRFPSPSHPLHSRSRELSLSMLVRDFNSPAAKGPLAIGESPRIIASPASPRVFSSSTRKPNVFDLGTPESLEKLARPSPLASLTRGRFGSQKARYLIQESPLQHTSKNTNKTHRPGFSDDWLVGVSLTPARAAIDSLTSHDPFSLVLSPWRTNPVRQGRPSSPTGNPPGTESPVLRNATLPSGVGLGIGLLAPFNPDGDSREANESNSFEDLLSHATLTEEEEDEAEVAHSLEKEFKVESKSNVHANSPPSKKRRTMAPPTSP
jgi:hypothetical protein